MSKQNTSIRGDAALLLANAKLVEAGITILKPVSECLKFDLVSFDGSTFSRLQIKRASPAQTIGKYKISLRRVSMTSKGAVAKKYSVEDTDFILGVVMETGDIYCLPISLVANRNSLTLNPKNISSKFSSRNIFDAELYKNTITLHNGIYTL
jgi:PD-(D/E)XK endonuclease